MEIQSASRLASTRKDIWSVVNDAVASCSYDPVVNLGQGFFGYNPPQLVRDALKEVSDRLDCNQYASPKGRPRLRKAIAQSWASLFGRPLDWDTEVLITTGANEGILSVIMAYVEPGDEVIVIEPFFDQFINNIALAGGVPKFVPLEPPDHASEKATVSSDWKVKVSALEAALTHKTKMLILNTPHNPTGKVFTHEEIVEIGTFCKQHSILLLSDEVYGRLEFLHTQTSNGIKQSEMIPHVASKFPDITLTVGSAGKDFAATGWRVGYVLGNSKLLGNVLKAHTSICFAAPNAAQEAFALGYENANLKYWSKYRHEIEQKMEDFNDVWTQLKLPFVRPQGGYLTLVNLSSIKIPTDCQFPDRIKELDRESKLCWFLINESVAALPSSGFYRPGQQENLLWFRFAVCREDDILRLAKERLMNLKRYI